MIVLALLGLAYLVFALYVSFDTEGGVVGMVPIFMHAVGVPLLVCGGLNILRFIYRWQFPGWYLGASFVFGVGAVGWLIREAGAYGASVHARRSPPRENDQP